MNLAYTGKGNVSLISGGGKIYTDIAARFCRSEKNIEEIIGTPYDKNLVKTITESSHFAATEFDYFIFGVEGYSRVTETQLVRKRHGNYLIKSGRAEKNGKRSFDVVVPESILLNSVIFEMDINLIYLPNAKKFLNEFDETKKDKVARIVLKTENVLNLIESWYKAGLQAGYKEEDLRYMKPQATEWKGIIGMNAHALIDWWKIRMCKNAQSEIKDLATKMYNLAYAAAPDLFQNAGANCKVLGYCPENNMQNPDCKNKIPTHKQFLEYAKAYQKKYK